MSKRRYSLSEMYGMLDANSQAKFQTIKSEVGGVLNATSSIGSAESSLSGSDSSYESSEVNTFTSEPANVISKPVQTNNLPTNVVAGEVVDTRKLDAVKSFVKEMFKPLYSETVVGSTVVSMDDEIPDYSGQPMQATPENVNEMAKTILTPDTMYCPTEEYKQPASNQQVEDLQNTIKQLTEQLNQQQEYINFAEKLSKVNFSKMDKKEQASTQVAYKKDCFDCNGNSVEFKRVKMEPDWNYILSECTSADKGKNLDKLTSLISMDLKNQLGGWNRVRTLFVYDCQLIINGVCYMPVVKGVDMTDFPLDTADYIRNGAIAPLFDWSNIKKMTGLNEIGFDDASFYITYVGDGTGLGRRIGVSSLFKMLPNLNILHYGSETIDRESLSKPEKCKKAIETMSISKRKLDLLDGFHLDIYSGTGGLRGYTWNNLKNYANNKGNKGLLHFTGGVLGRGLLAGAGLAIDLGAHVAGSVFKGVASLFSDATTPVTDEDIM